MSVIRNAFRKLQPPTNSIAPGQSNPAQDVADLGPVVRHNHIAYVPAKGWSGTPGTGTGNLAYVPDFLLTAPYWVAGNAVNVLPNAFKTTHAPFAVFGGKTVLEGIGGVQHGGTALQQLLEMQVVNGSGTSSD